MLISSGEACEFAETTDCIIMLIQPPLKFYSTHDSEPVHPTISKSATITSVLTSL